MDLTFAQPTYELSRLERRIRRDFAEERPRQLAIAISDRKKMVYGAVPNDRTRGPANIVAIAAVYFAGSSVRPDPPQPHDIVALQLLLGHLPFDRVQGADEGQGLRRLGRRSLLGLVELPAHVGSGAEVACVAVDGVVAGVAFD